MWPPSEYVAVWVYFRIAKYTGGFMSLLSYIDIQIKHINISQHHKNQPHATSQQTTALAVHRETGLGLISNVTLLNQALPTSSYCTSRWCTLFKDAYGEAVLLQAFLQHQFVTRILTYQLLHLNLLWILVMKFNEVKVKPLKDWEGKSSLYFGKKGV